MSHCYILLTFLGYDCHPHNVGCLLSHYEAHAPVNLHGERTLLASCNQLEWSPPCGYSGQPDKGPHGKNRWFSKINLPCFVRVFHVVNGEKYEPMWWKCCWEDNNIGVKYTNEFLSTQKTTTNQWIFVEFCKLLLQYCYRGDRRDFNRVHLLLSIFQGQEFLPKQQVANSLPRWPA